MSIHTLVAAIAVALALQTGQPQSTTIDGQTVYQPGNGVQNPVLLRKFDPKYTQEAMRAQITGEVHINAIVQPDGTVKVLGVQKSLDTMFGLDDAAVQAAKQWVFAPGKFDGKPVPVQVTLIMEFRLHSRPGDQPTPDDDFAKGTFKPTGAADLVAPVVIKTVAPKYTSEAMRAKLQGDVLVEVIVLKDGTVGKARISKSLDKQYGLDDAALEAAKGYLFKPGTHLGEPVPFDMFLTLEFRIH